METSKSQHSLHCYHISSSKQETVAMANGTKIKPNTAFFCFNRGAQHEAYSREENGCPEAELMAGEIL
jgi:hypothetical protein